MEDNPEFLIMKKKKKKKERNVGYEHTQICSFSLARLIYTDNSEPIF